MFTRRLDFFRSQQRDGQLFSDWIQELRRKGDECNLDELSRDKFFVFLFLTGIKDQKLEAELLKVTDPMTKKLQEVVQDYKVSKYCLKSIKPPSKAGTNLATANAVKGKKQGPKSHSKPHNSQSQNKKSSPNQNNSSLATSASKPYNCYRCGNKNKLHTCNAVNAMCKHCGKKGHFAGVLTPNRKVATGREKQRPTLSRLLTLQ